jgi:hypothetical protein
MLAYCLRRDGNRNAVARFTTFGGRLEHRELLQKLMGE